MKALLNAKSKTRVAAFALVVVLAIGFGLGQPALAANNGNNNNTNGGNANGNLIANSQSVTTNENTAVAFTLTGSGPSGFTYVVDAQPAHGSLSGTAPNLTYAPAQNFDGIDSFTFHTHKGGNDSTTATISITVNNVPLTCEQGYHEENNACVADAPTGSGGDNGSGSSGSNTDNGSSGSGSGDSGSNSGSSGSSSGDNNGSSSGDTGSGDNSGSVVQSVTLTVASQYADGSELTGMYTVLMNSGNETIAAGYTPMNFTLESGQDYYVAVANFGDIKFVKFDDGTTSTIGDSAGVKAVNINGNTTLTAIYAHESLVANSNGNRMAEFGHKIAHSLDKLQTIQESSTPMWQIVQGYMSGQIYASMYGADFSHFAGGWNGLTEGQQAWIVEHFDELVGGHA